MVVAFLSSPTTILREPMSGKSSRVLSRFSQWNPIRKSWIHDEEFAICGPFNNCGGFGKKTMYQCLCCFTSLQCWSDSETHKTMTRALDYDTYCNPSCRHHKLVMRKMANFELPTASFYPIGTSLIGIARPTGFVFFLDGIQGSTNEWFLGCENPTSELPLAAEGEFTQPRNHSLAETCTFRLHLHRALTLLQCLFKTSK